MYIRKGKKIGKKILLTSVLFLITATLAPAATRQSSPTASPRYVPNEIIVKFREKIAEAVEKQLEFNTLPRGLKLSTNLNELNTRYQTKRIKPLFKNFNKNRQRTKILLKKDKALLTKREKRILRRLRRAPKGAKVPDLGRIYKIEVELGSGQTLEEVVAAYNNDPDVEYAELNHIVSICTTPNDPCYPLQWALNNTGQMYPESGKCNSPPGTPDRDIDAPEAWDIHTGSSEIIVAVVDTGVDYNHRDLQGNMWTDSNGYYGYDFFNDDNNPMDDHGHGTHCAGIIAADGNNGFDIAGVCWNAKIMAVKFMGESAGGYETGAVNAIYYAVDNGADVISNSWSGDDYSETLEQAVAYAYSQGVIVVAGAGNKNSSSPVYPAHYDHVISVAATDSDDQRAICTLPNWASNYGPLVDIAAPGVDILSLRVDGTSSGTVYDDYTTIMSGTSAACPHVSGACALMLSRYPEIELDELDQHLLESTDAISSEICASGRLNVYEAMLRIPGSRGIVLLDNDYYSCSGTVGVKLLDLDLKENGTQQVTVLTNGGDSETVVLTETVPAIGVFTGTISTGSGDPNTEDGIVQVSHSQIITVIYYDANDGSGNPLTVEDVATADCEAPAISNVGIETRGIVARITFETDEPTTGLIRCGLACGGPYTIVSDDLVLATTHTIQLNELPSETTCYLVVDATDVAGNDTTDANNEACYSFTTDSPIIFNVPGEFSTIQAAIDEAWGGWGETVLVAEGTYYENINFGGKDIVLRSINPNNPTVVEATIIDGNDVNSVVTFAGTESSSCVLSGFTITNGEVPEGGGVCGNGTMATIENNIITGNETTNSGGGIFDCDGLIQKNIIKENDAGLGHGGGLCECDGTIRNNIISYNFALSGGGLNACDGTISNNVLVGNSSITRGVIANCNGIISNCTIVGNKYVGLENCSGTIKNCIVWHNDPEGNDQLVSCSVPSYSCIEDWNGSGVGNISADPCFASMGYWQWQGTSWFWWDWIDNTGDYHLKSEAGRFYSSAYVGLDPTNDNFINLLDFAAFAVYWGEDSFAPTYDDKSGPIPADLDNNGVVDLADLQILLDNYLANYISETWVSDEATSPCIDAGDPNSDWTAELWPHGKRINMGAYGSTPQASMSLSTVGNKADLNNDGFVNTEDLALLTEMWLTEDVLLSEDINRNGSVNFSDWAELAEQWLWQE